MAELTKLLLKVVNEEKDKIDWVHLSYVNKDLLTTFMEKKDIETTDMNEIISRWAKEDFNVDLLMSSTRDIRVLKHLIKDFYKRAHPELFIDSPTDRQGWVRVWFSRKMREELNIYGKECF